MDAALQSSAADAAASGNDGSPTSSTASSVVCRHCRRENPASRRFCGGCGEGLWEACPQCQTQCAADERFCGSCGIDIGGRVNELGERLRGQLEEAQESLAALRYDEAIIVLQHVAAVADARFAGFSQQALTQIARVETLRHEQAAAAKAALARARQAIGVQAYQQAAGELEQVPASLRSAEAAALLARAQSAQSELLALAPEIRAAVEDKRTAGLLPKLERLLTLKPGHKQALALAEQLRDQMLRAAKRSLAEHKYREALDQLDQATPSFRTADMATLTDTAGELLALQDGVEYAALADRPTLALAERLVKLAPANVAAARLREQVAERAKCPPRDARLAAADFDPPPKRTPLGPPVDWLARAPRLAAASQAASATLDEQPGQFFVALGLALQGLGMAAISLDLTPADKPGMMGLLNLPLGTKSPLAAWGLDVSDTALKAVKLVKDVKTGEVQVAAAEYILHERSLTDPEELNRKAIVERTLQNFLSRCGDLKACKIAIGMPGQRVLGRFFDVPPLPAKKVADAIAFEARHQLPIALEELCWASHVQDSVEGKAGTSADESPRRIVVAAARALHVRERIADFKAVGIAVDLVASDCLALHNALAYDRFAPQSPSADSQAICLLDVGAASTNVVISSARRVWFRTLGMGGDNFTSLLVSRLALTREQAEQVKRHPAKARRFSQWREALQPGLVQMAGEVERSLAGYARLFPDQPVRQIYGLGGAFPTHGLLRHLRCGK